MRTVITKNIDGFDVVIGFGYAVVDPMATRARVAELMKDDPDKKRAEEIGEEINTIFNEANAVAKTRCEEENVTDLKEKMKVYYEERAKAQVEIDVKSEELHSCLSRLLIKRNELRVKNPVFFNPKKGEYLLIDDVEYDSLSSISVPKGSLLLRDGSLIVDQRGEFYWEKKGQKWIKTKIKKLGFKLPGGARFFDDLSEADKKEAASQYAANYISTLSDEDFKDLIALKNEEAAMKAKKLRHKLKAEGDPATEEKVKRFEYETEEAINGLKKKRSE